MKKKKRKRRSNDPQSMFEVWLSEDWRKAGVKLVEIGLVDEIQVDEREDEMVLFISRNFGEWENLIFDSKAKESSSQHLFVVEL